MGLEFALARFDGEGSATNRFAEARGRSGPDPAWTREVGLVEHQHNGHLIMRGTFAGHYVDVDEADHVSQKGAGEGAVAGGVVGGAFLGPAGLAVGLVLGGIIGSQLGHPSDTEAEPHGLAEQLRAAVPRSGSAIVLIAPASEVEEMLAAVGESAQATIRQTLSAEQTAALEEALSSSPPAAPAP